MNILQNCPQRSEAWHAARAQHFCASEAPAMMGVSPYTSRNELLRQKATGIVPEVDAAKQALFDAGHADEQARQPYAVALVGEPLYPVVGTAVMHGLALLASLDGSTMDDSTIWENKHPNSKTADHIELFGEPPEHHCWQLEHQLLVSGAERALFTCGDAHCWYESKPERRARLIAGWKQFNADLATFVPAEAAEPAPVGRAPEQLPALHIVLKGEVSASNLAEFKEVALTAIRSVNRDLKTDQDFADSAKARKWCEDIEARVAAAKDHALSQTASIDLLFKTMDEVSAEAREVRLALEKLEKARKESRKGEIVAGAVKALGDHVASLNARIGRPLMPPVNVDFGAAIRGLKSFDSMQNAVDTALANGKIAASAVADRIQINLAHLATEAADHMALFPDLQAIAGKDPQDFVALVQFRIADAKAKEQKRLDAERERIRAEEVARIEREQRAEQERVAREQTAVAPAAAPAPAPAPAPAVIPLPARQPAAVDTGARITLGAINTRIAPLSISVAGLAQLGYPHVGKDRAAFLFAESELPHIYAAIVAHVQSLQAKEAA